MPEARPSSSAFEAANEDVQQATRFMVRAARILHALGVPATHAATAAAATVRAVYVEAEQDA